MGRRIARVRGDFLQRQLFLDVLLHEMDGSRYDIVLSRFVADGVPVLLQIAQCPEVVVEDGAGVEQVFMAVPHLQCPEYLFKHIDPVADAGVHPWFDLYRACALAGEMGSQLSFKMNPVDRPRLFLVGPVSVRFPCRQDEILVGGHLEFLSFRPVPARSLYTIDENELRDRLLPFPEMMPRFRIVSDIGNV